jgi:hypothetical protein
MKSTLSTVRSFSAAGFRPSPQISFPKVQSKFCPTNFANQRNMKHDGATFYRLCASLRKVVSEHMIRSLAHLNQSKLAGQ